MLKGWQYPSIEMEENPQFSLVELWNIYGPLVTKHIDENAFTDEDFIDLFYFTQGKSFIYFPVKYSLLKLPPCSLYNEHSKFEFRDLNDSENKNLIELCNLFEINQAKFRQILKSTKSVLSGSALLWITKNNPALSQKEWTPNDLDIYVFDENALSDLQIFFKSQNYRRDYISTFPYCEEIDKNLLESMVHMEHANSWKNKNGLKIQLILPRCFTAETYIAKYFDFPCLKKYFDGESISFIPNLSESITGTYMYLKLETYKDQLIHFFQKRGNLDWEKVCLTKIKRKTRIIVERAQKYKDRGYPHYLDEINKMVEKLVKMEKALTTSLLI